MFSMTDYDKLQLIMEESPEKKNFSQDFWSLTEWKSAQSAMRSATH